MDCTAKPIMEEQTRRIGRKQLRALLAATRAGVPAFGPTWPTHMPPHATAPTLVVAFVLALATGFVATLPFW